MANFLCFSALPPPATDQWSLECLSQALEMTPTVLRRKLAFWQSQGLLKESTQEDAAGENHHIYTLVEERTGLRGGSHDMLGLVDIEEEAESAMASAQQQKEEEMQVCAVKEFFLFYLRYSKISGSLYYFSQLVALSHSPQ